MNDVRRPPILGAPLLWTALAGGALVGLVLPAGVIVINDDFGYLGSVIETLRRGRPWTDEWLEPWSASLAGLSALTYKLTGSFRLAIQGIQVAGAAAAVAGAWLLFRSRGLSPRAAQVAALLALLAPALLWKFTEYTGMVLYLPCLLWAAWAAGERRWGLFFVVWLLAVSTRQSALAWLALPAWALLEGFRQPGAGRSAWLRPGLVLVLGVFAFASLMATMNVTRAQREITQHLWEHLPAGALGRNFAFGLAIAAIHAGIGSLLLGLSSSGAIAPDRPMRRILVVLGVAAVAVTFLPAARELFHEHSGYEGWSGQLYSHALIAAGLGGWLLVRNAWRGDFSFAAFAALSLVLLRREVWDYYFADVAIFALLAAVPVRESPAPATVLRWPRMAGVAAAGTLAFFHLGAAYRLKCRVDEDWANCVVTENALRAGVLQPDEIGHTPFGFVGWKLHRHYLTHEGRDSPDLGGFSHYIRPGATELHFSPRRFWRDSRSLRPPDGAEAARVLGTGIYRVGWFWHVRCALLRAPSATPPARVPLDPATAPGRRLPLDDREWRDFLARPGS
jgi:hypothetical protein